VKGFFPAIRFMDPYPHIPAAKQPGIRAGLSAGEHARDDGRLAAVEQLDFRRFWRFTKRKLPKVSLK
jgi:hypothetical protein